MKIEILFFAKIREILNINNLIIELHELSTLNDLIIKLHNIYPIIKNEFGFNEQY